MPIPNDDLSFVMICRILDGAGNKEDTTQSVMDLLKVQNPPEEAKFNLFLSMLEMHQFNTPKHQQHSNSNTKK